jgi:hypothetical protein
VNTTADIIALIDSAIGDARVSNDAMRGNPSPVAPAPRRRGPRALRVVTAIHSSAFAVPNGPELPVGQIVYEYKGPLYGCLNYDEIAVTFTPGQTPFWGIPSNAVEEA